MSIVLLSEAEGLRLLGEERPRRPRDPKEVLVEMIATLGLPEPVREYRFAREARLPRRRDGRVIFASRAWRFDWCWPDLRIALEFEGGIFLPDTPGRHTMPTGYEEDCVKYSYAALLGWVVLRVTAPMVRDGRAEDLLRFAFGKGWKESPP